MLKREKSDFQQTSGPRLRSDSHYACHLSLDLQCLSDSALGSFSCGHMTRFTSSLLFPRGILSFNSGLSSQRKCPVVPMMLQCISSCKTLREFFSPLPWHLHTILEFLSAQILVSHFCSVESLRWAICRLSVPFTITIVYQIICNKPKSEPKPRCAFADKGI